jgi:Holliday junction resolvasome RuvABC endonuclease subunit
VTYDLILGLDPSLTGFGLSDGVQTTTIVTTPDNTLRERAGMIFHGIVAFYEAAVGLLGAPSDVLWVVEAPLLAPHAASNAFDVGVIHSHIWDAASATGDAVTIINVAPTTLKKFVTGSGAADKVKMALAVSRKWKREFKNDNETDAYALWQYGCAVSRGEIEHIAPAKRGAKRRKAS